MGVGMGFYREPVGFGVDPPPPQETRGSEYDAGLLFTPLLGSRFLRFEVQGVPAGFLQVIYGGWHGFLQGTCRVWRGFPPGNQRIRIRCRIAVYSTLKLPLGVLKFRGLRGVSTGDLWGLAGNL